LSGKSVLLVIIGLATASVLFIGWGQFWLTSSTRTTSVAPTVIIVNMVNGSSRDPRLGFDPAEVHIVLGVNNTVTWKNDDTDWHTAHSNMPEFDSRMIPPGGTFTHTFLTPGIYPYHCDPHPWMTGRITVITSLGGYVIAGFQTHRAANPTPQVASSLDIDSNMIPTKPTCNSSQGDTPRRS
jgi:plastocyanin